MNPDPPDLPARRAVYQAIVDAPGSHFRALLRRLAMAQGTLQYHLRVLETEGLVKSHPDQGFTRYHPVGTMAPQDQKTLDALRREYARRIIASLVAGPATTTQLAASLGKAPSTVSWHLSRLLDAGIVSKDRTGQEVRYALVDAQRAVRLYTLHRGSLMDRLADRLLGLYD